LERYGAAVTVVESAPELRMGGQLVDVRGVAREVLVRGGVDAAVRAARTAAERMSFVAADGRRVGSLAADEARWKP
jgi:hypothetical protein